MFRADNARVKDPDGTGLGLYIIKETIEKTGGKIWFESKENKGSTFYVAIPLEGMKKKEGSRRLELK
jgi:two-component system sensor histidine kinase VicK